MNRMPISWMSKCGSAVAAAVAGILFVGAGAQAAAPVDAPKPVGVDEIHQAVEGWLKEHPEFAAGEVKERDTKLRKFAKDLGWKNGPELLRNSDKFYDKNGVNGAGWHGWMSTMIEYSKLEEPDD